MLNQLINEDYNQCQSMNSSTSSISEIIPRQQTIQKSKKDKAIIMKSIPMHYKRKQQFVIKQTINQNNQSKNNFYGNKQRQNICQQISKQISYTLINSTHANSNMQKSQVNTQIGKNEIKNFNNLQKSHGQSNSTLKQVDLKLIKSTHQKKYISEQNHHDLKFIQQFKQQSIIKSAIKQIKRQELKNVQSTKKQQQSKNVNVHFSQLILKNKHLQDKIIQLQNSLKSESQSIIIERKANQVYSQFYQNLSKMISQFLRKNSSNKQLQIDFSNRFYQQQSEIHMDEQSFSLQRIMFIIQKIISYVSNELHTQNLKIKQDKVLTTKAIQTEKVFNFEGQKHKQNQLAQMEIQQIKKQIHKHYQSKIIQLQEINHLSNENNLKLRNQLLQSTQKNINAIFNTQISATCCLQNQINKFQNQIQLLKQKIKIISQNNIYHNYQASNGNLNPNYSMIHPQIIYIPQKNNNQNNLSQYINSQQQKSKRKKVLKIYTHKQNQNEISSSSQQIGHKQNKRFYNNSLGHNKKHLAKRKRSGSPSSISSKQTKKRQQNSKRQIEILKEANKQIHAQLIQLLNAFSLVKTQQHEMKTYFQKTRQQIIKSLSQQNLIKQQNFRKQKQKILQDLQGKQQLLGVKLQHRQKEYARQLQILSKQKQQSQLIIKDLNNKVNQLINALNAPQRVNQEIRFIRGQYSYEEEIPLSQISIPVQYLRIIQKLKAQKQKLIFQNQQLSKQKQLFNKQSEILKQEIHLIKHKKVRFVPQKIAVQIDDSRQRNSSIINQLNGFTQIQLPSPFLHSNQQKENIIDQKNRMNATKNNYQAITKIQSQNIINKKTNRTKTQLSIQQKKERMNFQNNVRMIIASKQRHIENLQKQINNLDQQNGFLKQEIAQKQIALAELESYISALQKKSLNSIAYSAIVENNNMTLNAEQQAFVLQNNQSMKRKYENYVKNLKILLKQSRQQNKLLKQQIQANEPQADQVTQSNFKLNHSATHSERTTKNFPNSSSPGKINCNAEGQILIRKRTQIIDNQKQRVFKHDQRIFISKQKMLQNGQEYFLPNQQKFQKNQQKIQKFIFENE